jgi:hypothetical protein
MVEPKTIEQVLHFMKGHIHMSRYDEKFIDNIATLKQVTTNQVVLLDTLLHKYQRQFAKHELFVDKLVDLPWSVNVVESSPQYTEGHLKIDNDTIYFKCPFNRTFIDSFRKIELNSFIWVKEERQYKAPYSTYNLKLVLNAADKYFPVIHKCEVTQHIIETLTEYELMKYWEPTLVNRNGNWFIVASNSALDDSLGDLKLDDSVETLAILSSRGVTFDDTTINVSPKHRFACEHITYIEQSHLTTMVSWLKEIQCDIAYLSGSSVTNSTRERLKKELEANGIQYCDTNTSVSLLPISDYNFPVTIRFMRKFENAYDPAKVCKTIHIVNSEPINIK